MILPLPCFSLERLGSQWCAVLSVTYGMLHWAQKVGFWPGLWLMNVLFATWAVLLYSYPRPLLRFSLMLFLPPPFHNFLPGLSAVFLSFHDSVCSLTNLRLSENSWIYNQFELHTHRLYLLIIRISKGVLIALAFIWGCQIKMGCIQMQATFWNFLENIFSASFSFFWVALLLPPHIKSYSAVWIQVLILLQGNVLLRTLNICKISWK